MSVAFERVDEWAAFLELIFSTFTTVGLLFEVEGNLHFVQDFELVELHLHVEFVDNKFPSMMRLKNLKRQYK